MKAATYLLKLRHINVSASLLWLIQVCLHCDRLKNVWTYALTLSWWKSLSYRNQVTNLQCRSMNWFLYDRDLHHKRVQFHKIVEVINWICCSKYVNSTACSNCASTKIFWNEMTRKSNTRKKQPNGRFYHSYYYYYHKYGNDCLFPQRTEISRPKTLLTLLIHWHCN